MDEMLILVSSRAIERVLVVIAGIFSIYLGFRLFSITDFSASEIEGSFGRYKIVLKSIGPGVCFALFGGVILAYSLANPLKVVDNGNKYSYSNVAQLLNEKDSHRSDLVALNSAIEAIEQLTNVKDGDNSLSKVIERTFSLIIPRRNFHIQRAFSTEEMKQYNNLIKENSQLTQQDLKSKFIGDELILFSEIHFALNPLESL